MRGVLNVNKPTGITSYDVIRRIKPMTGETKIGHAGTLDPLAQGVLLILLGEATKVAELLQNLEKEYQAQVRLGVRTDTDDIAGRVIEERPAPAISEQQLTDLLQQFVGPIVQVPPVYSALKVGGVPAYDLARQGRNPRLPARTVLIKQIALLSSALPVFEFQAVVSKGTYIRALARDIGERLGCGATLQALTRTRIGGFRVENALALDRLDREALAAGLVPINEALAFMPLIYVKPEAVARLRNGQVLHAEDLVEAPPETGLVRVSDPDGKILVISNCIAGRLKPVRGVYADS